MNSKGHFKEDNKKKKEDKKCKKEKKLRKKQHSEDRVAQIRLARMLLKCFDVDSKYFPSRNIPAY